MISRSIYSGSHHDAMEHIRETHCSEESERGAFFGRLPLSRRKKETKSSVADSIIADVQYYQSMGGNTEVTELEHGPNIRKPSHLRVRSTLCFSLYYQYIQSRIPAASVASRNARRPVARARATARKVTSTSFLGKTSADRKLESERKKSVIENALSLARSIQI